MKRLKLLALPEGRGPKTLRAIQTFVLKRVLPIARKNFGQIVLYGAAIVTVLSFAMSGLAARPRLHASAQVPLDYCIGTEVYPTDEIVSHEGKAPDLSKRIGNTSGSTIRIVLEGSNAKAIIIDRLEPRILHRSTRKLPATYRKIPCEGDITPRTLELSLDPSPDVPHGIPGAIKAPYWVSQNETEVIHLLPRTTDDVHFELIVHWSSEGRSEATKVDNGGNPFRFIGSKNLDLPYCLSKDGWRQESC